MSKRKPIPAAFWWRSAGDDFEKVIREFLTRAKKADLAETGHDCGHRFEVIVRSSTHASGPGEHSDADYSDDMKPVTVRAHNLRDALLLAAALPLTEWFEQEVPADE